MLKYFVLLFFLLGLLVGNLVPNGISFEDKTKITAEHEHPEHTSSAEDCASHQCHVCHSSHCSMELCVADNLKSLAGNLSGISYKFNYSYSFSSVLERPPIFS